MAKVWLVALALLASVLFMAGSGLAAIDCNHAKAELAPCALYLMGKTPNPSTPCCEGVESIKNNCITPADRQATCECLKDAAARMETLDDSAAKQLADKCKVKINVPISKTVDCTHI